MIGAIIGDIAGSRFEFNNHRDKKFKLFTHESDFTDDTVCTVAVADWILKSADHGITCAERFASILQSWCKRYPGRGYGTHFLQWIEKPKRYNSMGNGAAMRISPVGDYFSVLPNLDYYSDMVTGVSHNHPDGLKGARAIANAIWFARNGASKADIHTNITKEFGYDLSFTCNSIRKTNEFNETCPVTVPQAIVAFLESSDFEDAIRNAISIGGDSDTIAAMAGSIAEAYYKKIPRSLIREVLIRVPAEVEAVIEEFYGMVSSRPDGDYKDIAELI